jgi:sugar lactone lactonase YvrE
MKKIIFTFFITAFTLVLINTSCSKKSVAPAPIVKKDTTDTTAIPLPPKILDTITVAGGNGVGNAVNQFYYPSGIFVDTIGNIYVVDEGNQRVQKWIPGADSGITVAGGNGAGSAANQFDYPKGLFVDKNGNIYVADPGNYRIQKWAPGAIAGITVAGGNGSGSAADQFAPSASNLYVDGTGNIYVSDYNNGRIQKFPSGSTSSTNAVTVAGGNGYGSGLNQIEGPQGIFVDASGAIYVSDADEGRIMKFPVGSTSSSNAIIVAGGNGTGSNANQLANPQGIFIDTTGNIYIADYSNNRVQKWIPNATAGITVAGTGLPGANYNQLYGPWQIFLDAGEKNLYIADSFNDRVQEWELK